MNHNDKFKKAYLTFGTIVLCALIMWGPALFSANSHWLWPAGPGTVPEATVGETVFDEATDYRALLMQGLQLAAVFVVLGLCGAMSTVRAAWRWRVTVADTLLALGLFAGLAAAADGLYVIQSLWQAVPDDSVALAGEAVDGASALFSTLTFAMVVYSLFNALYEEFFFLVLCRAARPAWAVFALSLLLRTAIHTYQGWAAALLIGVGMGSLYWVLYRRRNGNLYAFWLSHALADILGLSLLAYMPAG